MTPDLVEVIREALIGKGEPLGIRLSAQRVEVLRNANAALTDLQAERYELKKRAERAEAGEKFVREMQRGRYGYEVTDWVGQVGDLAAEVRNLTAQLDRMTEVVEAARFAAQNYECRHHREVDECEPECYLKDCHLSHTRDLRTALLNLEEVKK